VTETARQLLSVVEVAAHLGVSRFTVRSWLRQARIPYVRLGRRVLLEPIEVQRFIEANRVEARQA